jgi:hypothetical protein
MILGAVEVLLNLQAVVTGPGVGVKLTLNKTWLGMWFSMSTYPKVAMFLHVASQSRYTSGEICLLNTGWWRQVALSELILVLGRRFSRSFVWLMK